MNDIKESIVKAAAAVEAALPMLESPLASATTGEAALKVADQAVDGIVNFTWNGQTPTRVGRVGIDWSGAHHKHQEWPAQLNRFFFLSPLSQAYKATGDERYARAARDYLQDWLRAHPTREGWKLAPYDNTLNLSIRVGHLGGRVGWTGALPGLLESPSFDEAFVRAVLESIRVQLAYEMKNMPTVMNWRIAAADCLLAAGLKLSFLPEAAAWREFGVAVLNDAWHRQVLPQGCHAERNPSYHGWMTRVMTAYCNLGRALPELGLVMEPRRVARMWDYALACIRPNGAFNALHDCTGERMGPWNPVRPGDSLRRERERFLREWNLPPGDPPANYFISQAGQALLRTGWGEDDQYVTFDASVWGYSHCHLSRNSIQLHAFRQGMLVDPGSLTYEGSDPLSTYGKSTRAHNTCTLNGQNQGEADPQNVIVLHGPGYNLVHAAYEGGYWEGDFRWSFSHMAKGIGASHVRWMLWVQDVGLVVFDSMRRHPAAPRGQAEQPPSLECNWQLAENAKATLAADGSRADVDYGDCGLAMLFAHQPEGTRLQLFAGSRDPLRGWLPVEGGIVPAPQIVQELPRMEYVDGEFVTVLLPWGKSRPLQPVSATVWKSDDDRFGRVTLAWKDGHTDEIHWSSRLSMMLGRQTDFDTDAALVHVRKEAGGKVVKACAAGGTYLKPFLPQVLLEPGVLVWG
jgi:hypothetical protein